MSNIVYDTDLFNTKIKNEFLDSREFSKGTRDNLERVFKVTAMFEEEVGIDLCEFNRDQLRRLFFCFYPRTKKSSRTNVDNVIRYIDWAIDEGYTAGVNQLTAVGTEWKEQFSLPVPMLRADELSQIVSSRVNYQDKVILQLLSEGVCGKDFVEILSLGLSDIDPDGADCVVSITDGGNARHVTLSSDCLNNCLRLYDENEYQKKNGQSSSKSPVFNVVVNDFLIRTNISNTINLGKADKHLVHRRIDAIAKELNMPYLTPSLVRESGMCIYARDYIVENGKLEDGFYRKISDRFNIDGAPLKEIKKEFLNEEFVTKLYGM